MIEKSIQKTRSLNKNMKEEKFENAHRNLFWIFDMKLHEITTNICSQNQQAEFSRKRVMNMNEPHYG